jgi:hypothetical protein
MTKTEQATKFYAEGKIAGWNGRGQAVRVLVGKTWYPLNAFLIAELEG